MADDIQQAATPTTPNQPPVLNTPATPSSMTVTPPTLPDTGHGEDTLQAGPTPGAAADPKNPDGDPRQAGTNGQTQTASANASNPNVSDSSPVTPPITPKTPYIGTVPASIPNAKHADVQVAGVTNSVALALAGGRQYRTVIDPMTGKSQQVPIPISRGQIGMAIALQALKGAVAGLAQHGPGAVGKAAFAGLQQGEQDQQQRQQQQQEQAQQANADYQRQAAITQTNFLTHANQIKLSEMDRNYQQSYVDREKPIYDAAIAAGAVLADNVLGSDLLTKYHVTKQNAIATGVVAVPDPDDPTKQAKNPDGSDRYETTFAVIDPSKTAIYPPSEAQYLADHHVPGTYTMVDGKPVANPLPENAKVRLSFMVNNHETANSLMLTEQVIGDQLAKLGDKGPDFTQEFKTNLQNALGDGSMTPSGVKIMAQYAGLPLDQIVAAMQKDKVKPDLITQVRSVLPADAVQQLGDKRVADAAKAKADQTTAAKLEEQKALAPGRLAEKKADANVAVSEALRKQTALAPGALQAEKDKLALKPGASKSDAEENLTHPELADVVRDQSNYNTPDGTNQKFLAGLMQIDPERARMIQSYSKGMDLQSYYAAVKKFGGSLNADIHAYDPTFNSSEMRRYDKTLQESGAAGKLGKTNAAANTALEHLGALYDAYGFGSATGLSGDYTTALNQASTETASMYANGNKPGEEEIKHTREALDHPNLTSKGRAATIKTAREALDKIEENYNQYDKDLPLGIKRQGPLSPVAAAAYKKMTGEDIDPRLVNKNYKAPAGGPSTKPQAVNPGAASGVPAPNPGEQPVIINGVTTGYTTDGKTYSRQFPQQ